MNASWYLARAALRRTWRGAVALAVVLGVLWGVSLAAAIGARRTATAYARMTSATKAVDLVVLPQLSTAASRLDPEAIRRLPGVSDFEAMDGYNSVVNGDQISERTAAPAYAFREGAVPYRFERLALLSGRRPLVDRTDEAVVTPDFAKRYHLKTGDRFVLSIFDPSTFAVAARQPMRIVAIGQTSDMVVKAEGLTFPTALVTKAFDDRYRRYVAYGAFLLRLRPGTDVDALKRRINGLAPTENIVFGTHAQRVDDVARASGPQVVAIGAFAAVVAFATLLAAVQVTEQVLNGRARRSRIAMVGLGATPVGRAAHLRLGAVLPIVLATVTAGITAFVLSARFPVGVVRSIEVHPGGEVHAAGLALGLLAPLVLMLVAVEVIARRAVLSSGAARRGGLARIAPMRSWPLGMAQAWTTRSGRIVAGSAAATAFAVASLVVAQNLHAFVSTPARFGWNWGASMYIAPAEAPPAGTDVVGGRGYGLQAEALGARLDGAEGVAGASLTRFGQTPIGTKGALVPLVALRQLHGDVRPAVLSGQLPRAKGEIALGALIARSEHVGIGDRIAIGDGVLATSLRIVGIVAVPGLGPYPGADAPHVGAVALVSFEQFAELQPPGSDLYALVRFDPTVAVDKRHALIERTLGFKEGDRLGITETVRRNVDVVALSSAQRTPFLLVGTMSVLTLVVLTQALVAETRRRRSELAVLSVLGGTPRVLRRLIASYTLATVGVATIVGSVVGVIVGRLIWGGIASSIGVAAGPVLPWRQLLLAAFGALVLGLVASWWPSRFVRRGRPAEVLRVG